MTDYPSLFRSEEMSFVELFVPAEVAHDTVYELGLLGNVQFKDMNPTVNPFQRSFVGEIRRLDDMARKVRFLSVQISNANSANEDQDKVPVRSLEDSVRMVTTGPGGARTIDELEVVLGEHEDKLSKMNDSYKSLCGRLKELTEVKWLLRETAVFFERAHDHQEEIRSSFDESAAPLLQHEDAENQYILSSADVARFDLEFVAGTLSRERIPTLERLLWRVLRGNLYMNHIDIPTPFVDPITQTEEYRGVFIIFAHGSVLLTKIRKICDSMGASLYPIDANLQQRRDSLREVSLRLADLELVVYNTKLSRMHEMNEIGKHLKVWEDTIKKEKKVFEVLNLFSFDARRRTLIAEGWVPTRDIGEVQFALREAARLSSSSPAVLARLPVVGKVPPTYHRVNKFTRGFQDMMDSYGIARYGEVNPALYATVTFPFLFAVMFGDLGHAGIVLVATLYMIWNEKRLEKKELHDLVAPIFQGRYIILLMGIFSLYTGMMYNDIFSRTLHLFQSGWTFHQVDGDKIIGTFNGRPYPFGLDPAWHGAANNLVFVNSYKMKMSIILGVSHMTFALCLSLVNHVRFNRPIDIWGNFVPQMLFLQSIFGYLVVTILYKWSVDWTNSPTSPPSLLNMLIGMFLQPGKVDKEVQLYRGQPVVQVILLCTAGICVPWLLCAKPLWIWKEMRGREGYVGLPIAGDDESDNAEDSGASEHEEDFSEVIIHQTIHTIEFCLNCISHTASYLRLWALSLAHAQLSEVLWNMTLGAVDSWIGLVLGGYMWLSATVGILCLMEGLSAYLHALRLHWVEANSKHFEGGGHAFSPLTFTKQDNEELALQ